MGARLVLYLTDEAYYQTQVGITLKQDIDHSYLKKLKDLDFKNHLVNPNNREFVRRVVPDLELGDPERTYVNDSEPHTAILIRRADMPNEPMWPLPPLEDFKVFLVSYWRTDAEILRSRTPSQ